MHPTKMAMVAITRTAVANRSSKTWARLEQDRQAVQGEREEDGHRQEPPGHQAARGVAGDRRHQPATRPGHEHAEGQREHPQGRVQGHLVVGGAPTNSRTP